MAPVIPLVSLCCDPPCTSHLWRSPTVLALRQADSLHFFPLPRWYPLYLPGDHEETYEEGASAVKTGPLSPALLMCVQLVAMDEMIPVPVSAWRTSGDHHVWVAVDEIPS
jgi:hypothetical protein